MTDDPFAEYEPEFEAPPNISSYPSLERDFQGHLLIFKPSKYEEGIPSPDFNPAQPQYQNRITSDVWVVDGPLKNPDYADEAMFSDVYFSQDRIVKSVKRAVGTNKMIVGRPKLKDPSKRPGKGNAWNLEAPTAEEMAAVRAFWADQNK